MDKSTGNIVKWLYGLARRLKTGIITKKGGEIVNLLHEYYIWLLKHVHFNDNRYDLLMQQLFDSPFEVILDRDVNRIDDCLSLRGQFFYEIGVNGDFSNKEACILELLISLAIRIDNEYLGNPDDPHPEFMFWEMICNLKLVTIQIDNHLRRKHNVERISRSDPAS